MVYTTLRVPAFGATFYHDMKHKERQTFRGCRLGRGEIFLQLYCSGDHSVDAGGVSYIDDTSTMQAGDRTTGGYCTISVRGIYPQILSKRGHRQMTGERL